MRRLTLALMWLALCAVTSPVLAIEPTAVPPVPKAVLVLYSLASGTPAMSAFGDSLEKALRESSGDSAIYYSEFLNGIRFSRESDLQAMRDYLRRRYEGRRVDVVVAIGNAAATLLLDRHQPLFPSVPAMFYGVDRPDLDLHSRGLPLPGGFGPDQRATLELALGLHPGTEDVYVVVQSPVADVVMEPTVRGQLAGLDDRVRLHFLTNVRTPDLIANLKRVSGRSLILYVWQAENLSGAWTQPREVLALIASAVSVPIYGGFDTYVGYGIVGGSVFNTQAHGAAVGTLVWRVANGERPQDLQQPARTEPMFDARQLRRWGIRESALPAGSIVLFREPSFWAQYQRYAIAGLSIFAVQLGLIGTLLVQRTRRRRAERALRDSEERHRFVVQTQTDLVCRFLPDTTLTFVNDAYCRFRQQTAAELIGTRIIDKSQEIAREDLLQHFASLAQPPHIARLELAVARPDGSRGWNEWLTHALLGPDGAVVELMGIGRDITDRKQAEDALRNSEARNRALLRAIPDLMFVMSHEGIYLDYHAKDPRDLYVPPEQFLGKSVFEVMPPDLASLFADAIAKAKRTSEPCLVEYALPLHGETRYFEARMVGFEQGQQLTIVRDQTDQKRAEARLRVSEDRYALATSAGGVGVWDWDMSSDQVYIDPEVLRILGYEQTYSPGQRGDWMHLVHPHDQNNARTAVHACLEGHASHIDIEPRMLHKDGSIRWFQARGSTLRRADGTAYRMVGTLTDVTVRRRADDTLRDQEAKLRANYLEIQDLAGRLMIGQETERKRLARELHDDLGQKVALMAIDIDQLRQDEPEFVARVRRISQYVCEVVTDMHRLSYQLHPYKLEALGLVAAIQSACDDVSAQHGVAVEFTHDRVPAHIHPDVALCLFRIVQEGLRNVVRHSKAKRASVYLGPTAKDLYLQIADSGVGFVLEERERTGLGLVSMRERVHFLGGELAIHPAPGSGTRIGVRVPLEPGRSTATASADSRDRPNSVA